MHRYLYLKPRYLYWKYCVLASCLVVSKLLERLVSRQLTDCVHAADLRLTFQSAYEPPHSMKTAVLHVLSEILTSTDHGNISALVLLDLSAALNKADHAILLQCLKLSFGIVRNAYSWFQSYLSGCSQCVCLGSVQSSTIQLVCSIPKGSVLGPILFLIYTANLMNLVEQHDLKSSPVCLGLASLRLLSVEWHGCTAGASVNVSTRCCPLDAIEYRLQLHADTTELLWCATARRQDQLTSEPLQAGTCSVYRGSSVRDLRIFIDGNLTMQTHVRTTVASYFAVICQLTGIGRSVPADIYKSLINSPLSVDLTIRESYTVRPAQLSVQHDAAGAQCCSQISFSYVSV
jgi:Reverse transcriptase (RNA-dependent DNA polymerase)